MYEWYIKKLNEFIQVARYCRHPVIEAHLVLTHSATHEYLGSGDPQPKKALDHVIRLSAEQAMREGLDPVVEFDSPVQIGEPQLPPYTLPVPITPLDGQRCDLESQPTVKGQQAPNDILRNNEALSLDNNVVTAIFTRQMYHSTQPSRKHEDQNQVPLMMDWYWPSPSPRWGYPMHDS